MNNINISLFLLCVCHCFFTTILSSFGNLATSISLQINLQKRPKSNYQYQKNRAIAIALCMLNQKGKLYESKITFQIPSKRRMMLCCMKKQEVKDDQDHLIPRYRCFLGLFNLPAFCKQLFGKDIMRSIKKYTGYILHFKLSEQKKLLPLYLKDSNKNNIIII